MSGLTLYCDGVVDVSTLACSTGWQTVVANAPFDVSQIDPVAAVGAFAAGFFIFLPVYVVCVGGAAVIKAMRT